MRLFHPDIDSLRAFGTGGRSSEHRSIATHVLNCPRCRATLVELQDLPRRVREATTVVPPADAWEKIVAARHAGDIVVLPFERKPARHAGSVVARARRTGFGKAAALLLAMAGVASATIPASPVRAWIESITDSGAASPGEAPAPVVSEPQHNQPVSGISVEPVRGEVQLSFVGPSPGSSLRIRLTDAEAVEVVGRGAAAKGVFRSAPGRVEVLELGAGEVSLGVPRSLVRFSVSVNGVPYLMMESGEIRIFASRVDTAGGEFILPIP